MTSGVSNLLERIMEVYTEKYGGNWLLEWQILMHGHRSIIWQVLECTHREALLDKYDGNRDLYDRDL